ncbi:hypothetical protein ACQ5SO_00965 [Rhodovulum sp. DZ06]|uniref:hypothetical protein n=1 Tax=Rhodovulum sp. DZ06 TaxID=3425126 RepID=UPI003D331F99
MAFDDAAPRAPWQPREGEPTQTGGARSRKLVATLCVLGWSAFWVFGFLALSGDMGTGAVWLEGLAAAAGFGLGMWAYLDLCRDTPTRARAAAPEHDPRTALDEARDEEHGA